MRNLLTVVLVFSLVSFSWASEDEVTTFTAEVNSEGIQRVDIVGGDYYFKPAHIIVKVGIPVEFVVKKAPGLIPHNIIIDEPDAGIQFKVKYGKKGEVIGFTPSKTGIYPFYCDKRLLFFKNHRKKGMEGKLQVVD